MFKNYHRRINIFAGLIEIFIKKIGNKIYGFFNAYFEMKLLRIKSNEEIDQQVYYEINISVSGNY